MKKTYLKPGKAKHMKLRHWHFHVLHTRGTLVRALFRILRYAPAPRQKPNAQPYSRFSARTPRVCWRDKRRQHIVAASLHPHPRPLHRRTRSEKSKPSKRTSPPPEKEHLKPPEDRTEGNHSRAKVFVAVCSGHGARRRVNGCTQ